jgi:putative DNA primase/helicase
MRDTIGRSIAKALGGRKVGGGWMARCPAHHDRMPSLSICDADDGKVLVHCHAGCDQKRIIAVLRSLGMWQENGQRALERSAPCERTKRQPDYHDTNRKRSALALWRSSVSAGETLVETYLNSRGLQLPVPQTIRFHAGLKHSSGCILPAMVALVTRGVDDVPLAIHRTFLARDGSGKAPVDPQKMMLGPCRGAAVRLGPAGAVLMVGEGIETSLAAMQATGYPAWAALSTSGLRTLDLPDDVRDVIVLADGDEAGEAAARGAALRWKREGRRVRIAFPSGGMDFNDMLLGRAPKIEEGVQ